MAKQSGKRPTLTIKAEKSAKSRVEEMFGGTTQPTEPEPTMVVEAVVPIAEAIEEGSVRSISDAIDGMFDGLGTDTFPNTKYPPGPKNNGQAAAEFVIARQLKKRAEARYKAAEDEARKQGCFGNPEDYREGDTVEVYRTGAFTFSVTRNKSTSVVDKELVEEVLREVAPHKWQELLERCKKPRAGATQIVTSLR
jgi:hypothetical protein